MKNEDAEFLERAFAFFVLIILISSGAFAQQIPNTKPKIEIINGVKTIKNPAEPLYGEITLDLKENLSIGREDDEHYAFFKDVGLNVDHEGNIYVFDRANLRIQKFDKNGQYLLTIGRKGQGPGEFQVFRGSYIDADNNLFVGQFFTITKFDKHGKLNTTINAQFGLFKATSENRLMILASSMAQNGDVSTQDIVLIDSLGKPLKKIASFDTPLKMSKVGNQAVGAFNSYNPGLFLRPPDDDFAVYGFSSEYKLFVVNSEGKIVQVIQKEESPERISEKEKDEAIDREIDMLKSLKISVLKSEVAKVYNFPPHKPFFFGMLNDDLRNIFVFKMRTSSDGKRERFFDLFSKNGEYLYRVFLKERIFPAVIANKSIYCAIENESAGLYEIKRYEIKNWGQIEANQ